MTEKNRLDNDELEKIAGGELFYAKDISNNDPNKLWEVLNSKGEVLDRAGSQNEAIWLAGKHNVSYDEVEWKKVQEMRGQG